MNKRFLDTHTPKEALKNFEVALARVTIDNPSHPDVQIWMALWGMLAMLTERIEKLEEQLGMKSVSGVK